MLAVVIAGGLLIAREWDAIATSITLINPAFLGLAALAAIAHVAMSYGGWRVLLQTGEASEWTTARMFFVGQMGKYLPGGIWSFLAIAEYGRDAGISHGRSWSASLIALGASIIAGVALALAVTPQIIFPALGDNPLAAFALIAATIAIAPLALKLITPIIARFAKGLMLPGPIALSVSVAASVATWLLGGLNLMLIADGLNFSASSISFLTFGAIYAAAWIAGFAFFVAPAGIGAREGVMVALLANEIPLADALVIALISRILVTVADFLLGGGALAIRPATPAAPPTARPPHQG
ncbi:MAG: lysylphosphatidylglycerol synthase domain-containing protein [Pseudomonadota bacterium]